MVSAVAGLVCVLAAPASIGTAAAQAAPKEPIVLIVLENKTYSDIVGSKNAPYIQSLIAAGTLYTNYQAAPGSLPDYLMMTSGVNSTSAAKNSDNIFNQLQGTAGVTWGEYIESMPSACYTKSGSAPYDKSHNPAVWYKDITSHAAACANVLPFSAFDPTHLRTFSYVVPNDNDDMHSGNSRAAEIQAGDSWLAAHVPAMVKGGARVIVTWDEGKKSDEHIATIAIGGGAKAGATDPGAYTHYGLLAGLEDVFGVPRLNAAKTATPFPLT
jgi:hypothetical protein